MWLLIFISAFVCASVSADVDQVSTVFRKCCPKNYSLIKTSELNVTEEQYECLDRNSFEANYNISRPPLLIGDLVPIEYGIPSECEGLLDSTQVNEVEFSMPESLQCYDKMILEISNGTLQQNIPKLVTLTCIINKTESIPQPKIPIDHIRKCCSTGQTYDTTYHICRRNDPHNSEEVLMKALNLDGKNIYQVENGLDCKANEYSLELTEETHSLVVLGSNLVVTNKNKGDANLIPQGEWCIDRKYEGSGLVARLCNRDCSAFGAYCVKKCCPVGKHYKTKRCGSPISKCVPSEDDEVPFDILMYLETLKREYEIPDILGIRSDIHCPEGKVMLNRSISFDAHQLTPDGYLKSAISDHSDYCLEAFDSRHCPGGDITVTAVTCFVKSIITKDFRISFVIISISSVCLGLTLLVYCALPELRNLHGRTLICHVSMMLLAFTCLARVQYAQVPDSRICTSLGYGIYFGFVAAFSWLNVMCLDIWWTFGSVRTIQPLRKAGAERRRFLWYSLYAWSFAITLTLTMFLLDVYPVSKILDANIGDGMCWFGSIQNTHSDWPHYIFFVIPMGLVSCTNFILWVLTARHCARVKSEVHRLQAGSVGDRAKRRFRVDRAKYILTGKLWVVMGAGWISELLSTLSSEPKWLWTIIDLLNELQGVFIFLILVFKPKLYYLIRKRLGLEKPDAQKNGPSSSARTSSTFLSRTISSDERANLRISQLNNTKHN